MLSIEHLDFYYRQIQALHDVSLEVGDREAVAVLGANGAGKSTLIKTIVGWRRPRQGNIHFDGHDVTHLTPWERASLGLALVPEGGRVFRELSVMDNLRLGAYLQPNEAIREQLDVVFELFPVLAERKTQVAKTLSGGEQQMLAIARAMMSRPRLLLVDEISMGLMPILVKRVFGVINDLRQRGVSILLVEQNAYEALKVVDRAYVLENGRIVLEGTAEDLEENPRVKAAYLGG
ncbi:MAG TPA: ABC transporter ATP-binding protein [Anaerolineae bacterium]|nr:ABC transporter ATP-binding protein [Anaerolineae bacterium]HIP97055.1 ABC transporter ATP-binding protein [Anaerolineae bacterium]